MTQAINDICTAPLQHYTDLTGKEEGAMADLILELANLSKVDANLFLDEIGLSLH